MQNTSLKNTKPLFASAINFLLVICVAWTFFSCDSYVANESFIINEQQMMQDLELANRMHLAIERQEIIDFIDRYDWVMKETGSGLHYHIYHAGQGAAAEAGKTALIDYSIYLLNGDLVYSSEQEGSKSFRIGQGGVESGLEEAILLLRVGDKARFILPAHMAHGVPGDGVKIPGQAAILYEMTLLTLHS